MARKKKQKEKVVKERKQPMGKYIVNPLERMYDFPGSEVKISLVGKRNYADVVKKMKPLRRWLKAQRERDAAAI